MLEPELNLHEIHGMKYRASHLSGRSPIHFWFPDTDTNIQEYNDDEGNESRDAVH